MTHVGKTDRTKRWQEHGATETLNLARNITTLENCLTHFFIKSYTFRNLGIFPKEVKLYILNIHSSFTHNIPKLEMRMSLQVNGYTNYVIYSYDVVLLSNKKG